MIIELKPGLSKPATLSQLALHHPSKDASVGCGQRACRPTCCRHRNQNCLEKTQETSI
uniref:Uncharacterized protein n=1 Tax=Arundo donax TaxID=35708 RepID=A0A0A8Z636_ARUDO